MKDFDTIIIGSGAGGLATAICLARAGQKVLVLEQHDVPGGWCHSFMLHGQRFSPGVHYIGAMEPGESTNLMYEGLGVSEDLLFFRMNPKGFEHCCIGEDRIDLPAGLEAMKESLAVHFPSERKGIQKYLSLVRNVGKEIQLIPKMDGFWDNITIPFRTKNMGKYGLFSLDRVVNWHVRNPLLRTALNIQCGDHGLPPQKASFLVHSTIMDHYGSGGFYPMGGGGGIVKAMTNGLKKHGGEIRVKSRVGKIIIEDRQAIGVELVNGEKITANHIVSNADLLITYDKLVGREHLSRGLQKKLAGTRWSVTSLMLFLTLDMDVTQAGIDSGNIWWLDRANIDDVFGRITTAALDTGDEFPALFISCTTLKDPSSFNGRYHNLEIVTYIDYGSFNAFNGSGDHHGAAYTQLKESICRKIMNSVERFIPGAKDHVVQMELGTPKTNEFYIETTRGNVYGSEKSLTQVGPFSFQNKTEIKNLFVCGASTLSHGVAGATLSGVNTAALMLNCKSDDLIKADGSKPVRICDAEDETSWPEQVRQKRADRKRTFKEDVKV